MFLSRYVGEMAMETAHIIKQDVKAVHSAFQNDDFRMMNVFSNRIMANALLDEDPRMTLLGFFLKEMARMHREIKARTDLTTFSTAKSLGETYIESIKLESDIKELWEQYHHFYNRIRKHQQNEYEKESYKEDVKFTHSAFHWLIEKLNEDRDVLFNDNNQFVRGILNEMDRIFRVHGGELVDLYALSLVKALQLYCEYIDYFSKDEKKEVINKSLLPYIDDITEILLKDVVDPKEVTLLLRRIIAGWRLSFIHFMERPRLVSVQREERVPITEETKKKISETVEKALEEEVK